MGDLKRIGDQWNSHCGGPKEEYFHGKSHLWSNIRMLKYPKKRDSHFYNEYVPSILLEFDVPKIF